MLFLVALVYLVGYCSATCNTDTLVTCFTTNILNIDGYCKCWDDFAPSLADCGDTQLTVIQGLIPTLQSKCPNAQISITPTDCITSAARFALCNSLTNVPGQKSSCDCWIDYKSNGDQYCQGEQKLLMYPLCLSSKVQCDTITCDVDCSLFDSELGVKAETEFETCITNNADHCACFTASTDLVGGFTSACNGAAKVKLSSCVKAQLDCPSLLTGDQCKTTEIEVSIDDISKLFDEAKDKFIANWNTKLTNDGKSLTVSTCDKTANGNDIVFTITVNYDDAKQTLQQVIDDLKAVLASTIGLPETKLSGSASAGAKRSVSAPATATVTMTGTGSSGSGASTLSFVMIPVLAIAAIFHYFF